MADKILGIKLNINSDNAINGLQAMRRAVAAAKSESRAMNSVLGDWKNTAEGLENQLESLKKQEEARKTYIGILRVEYNKLLDSEKAQRKELEHLIATYGEESAAVKTAKQNLSELTVKIENAGKRLNDEITVYNKLTDEIDKYGDMLSTLTSKHTLLTAELKNLIRSSKDATNDVAVLSKQIEVQELNVESAKETLKKYEDELSKLEEGSAAWMVMKAHVLDAEGAVAEATNTLEDMRLNLIRVNASGSLEELQQAAIQSKAHMDALAAATENCEEDIGYMRAATVALSDDVKYQNAVLESLKKRLMEAENSTDVTCDAVNDLRRQLSLQEETVRKSTAAFDRQRLATDNLESSTKGFNKILTFTKKHLDDVKKENALLNDGFTVLKGTLSHLVSHGVEALFGRLHVLMGASRELRKELGMLQATAETMNLNKGDVEKSKNTLGNIYRVTEDTTGGTEAINNLLSAGFNFDDVGPSLDDVTRQLLGASIKWKDTLSMEGLSDSIQEAIGSKGMSVTGQFAELIERLGYDIKVWKTEFSGLGTEAERQDKIYKTLADNGLEDVLKQYERINGSLVKENDAVYDTMMTTQRFTEVANPIIIALQQGYNQLMEVFVKFAETHTKEIEMIKQAIGSFFDVVAKGLEWVLENLDIVSGVIATMLAANWSIIAVAGISKIKDAIGDLGTKILTVGLDADAAAAKLAGLGNAKIFSTGLMNVAKFGAIGLAIAGVIAVLVLLYQKSEEFRAFVDEFFASLMSIGQSVWQSLQPLIAQLGILIKTVFELIASIVEMLLPVLKLIADIITDVVLPIIPILIDAIGEILSVVLFVVNGVVSAVSTVAKFIEAIFKTIGALFSGNSEEIQKIWSELGEELKKLWANVWEGLLKGLTDGWSSIKKNFADMIDKWVKWFKELFGIHSPSTLFASFGKFMMQGLINGITNMFGNIKGVVTSIVNFFTELPSRIWSKIKSIGEKISDAFKSAVSLVKGIGEDIVKGLWNGINSKIKWVKNKITEFCNSIGKSITDFFDINSPSKWAMAQGGYIAQGVGLGVLNGANDALRNVNKFSDKLTNGFNIAPDVAGLGSAGGTKIINAGLTVQYNKELSLKEISKLESKYYSNIRKFK